MKKTISLLLALLLVISCFAFCTPDANALGAVWVKEFYKDKFGDKTDQYYITNKSQFKGTYNSNTGSNGKIGADLICERDEETFFVFIKLFIKGKDQVVNSSTDVQCFDIAVKKPDGSEFTTSAKMLAGEGRMIIKDALEFMRAMVSGDISIYIEEKGKKNNNYLFHTKEGNFEELFTKEIWLPYQEMRYQKAEALLNSKRFDDAAKEFQALGDYNDSAARIAEVIEAKNADAYAKAERLLQQKEYDKAISVFKDLGDYKDSKARVAEVIEAKNADAYAEAERLFQTKEYDRAIEIFTALGEYRDSSSRINEVLNTEAYSNAEELLKAKKYQEAIDAFWALGDYKDSKERVEEAIEEKNASIYAQAEEALRKKNYYYARELFKYLGQYKDSAKRALEVDEEEKLSAYKKAEGLLLIRKYDEAIEAFEALGSYRDSSSRIDEVIEAKKADAYSRAERLLQKKKYDEAIEAFQELEDYRDSIDRVNNIIEERNKEMYSQAIDLLQKREIEKAYDILIKIQGFKDVDYLLTTNKDFITIYQERDRLERQLREVGSIIRFGKYEQDNNTDNGDEPVEWKVICVEDNRSLIISQNILATRPYNKSQGGFLPDYRLVTIEWEECSIRSWLNEAFYEDVFDSEEKIPILASYTSNTVTMTKSEDVLDNVFLLSEDEARQYGVIEKCYTTELERSRGYDDICSWWLRGDHLTYEGKCVSEYGKIESNPIDSWDLGIRPAVWVNTGSDYFLKMGE